MKRLSVIILFALLWAVNASPQNYTLKGQVEEIVHVGERFRLSYTVNSRDADNFRLGHLPDDIDLLFTASSVSSSTSYTNGHLTSNSSMTITCTLCANAEGQFTIPPASIDVNGHTIRSKALTVTAVPSGSHAAEQSQAGQRTSGEYFFVLANPTKRRVVQYEPLLLTYKVCWHTDLPVASLDNISLELQNVYMQPYNESQQVSRKLEQIRGRTMCTVDWQQYVIYPQKAGTLHIPSTAFNGYVRQTVQIDPYAPFTSYNDIPQELHTPELSIQVDSLPERPDGFSLGVGRLSISASPDKTTLKANTPLKLTVTVSGQGNLNMIKEPIVEFPSLFDTYDTRQTENYEVTANGISGDIAYEFMAVPQREGSYVIPPVKLIYYDLDTRAYRTILTDSFRIAVTPGDPGSDINDFSDGAARQLDIRPIKSGPSSPGSRSHAFFASGLYWILVGSIVGLAALAFLGLHLRALGRGDAEKNRAGKARRVATRRLRKAEQLMRKGNTQQFYDETLRALWGYVGDRLNMPVSSLTRDNVSQQLQEHGVSEQPIALFVKALDECEFMRYAPGDPQGNMTQVYDLSANAIVQIENEMKSSKKKHHAPGAAVIVTLLMTLGAVPAGAITKEQADEAYSNRNYEEAIEMYGQLLSQAPDASVYYNMGNAYYRLGDMAHAVLCYERALLLQPGDTDTRFNLQLAYSKTEDNIAPEREMFFVTWYHALSSWFSSDVWAVIAVVMLALAMLMALVYWFAYGEGIRKTAFYSFLALFVLFILANIFAWQQHSTQTERRGAVIMQPQVSVTATPSEGAPTSFTLHAGTKVTVDDDTMAGWLQVTLPDGRKGWLPAAAVEVI